MNIFIEFVTSLIIGILLGIVGLGIGADIGANYGFPAFGGNAGYEAGGVFFAIIGISIGSLLGIIFMKKIQKERHKYLNTSIAAIILIFIEVIIFDTYMSAVTGIMFLLLPPIVLTAIANWQKFSQSKNNND